MIYARGRRGWESGDYGLTVLYDTEQVEIPLHTLPPSPHPPQWPAVNIPTYVLEARSQTTSEEEGCKFALHDTRD